MLLAGTACSATAALGQSDYAPSLVAHCFVWFEYFNRAKKPIAAGIEEVFAGTAAAGYRALELTPHFFQPAVAARTAALLEKHRLAVPVVYNDGVMYSQARAEQTISETVELAEKARRFGLTAVNFNASPKRGQGRKTDQELAFQALAIDRLADELHKRGMRLFIHQRALEMAEEAREWRHILIHTDHDLVEFCLDIHWLYRGGQNVMTLLGECGRRLADLHLRNSQNGIWLEQFRDGDVDYHTVAAYLRRTGFRGYLTVELAYEKKTTVTRPLVDNLRLSREYTEKVFRIQPGLSRRASHEYDAPPLLAVNGPGAAGLRRPWSAGEAAQYFIHPDRRSAV